MALFNLGSINIDHVYSVPHIPAAGETIAAQGLTTGLGGKGLNQSVAAARAGARPVHVGAVGQDGAWVLDRMRHLGLETGHVAVLDAPTGHANITVDAAGENMIVLLAGANRLLAPDRVAQALQGAAPGDTLLLQNETNLQPQAAEMARARGLRVVYSAAPFDVDAVRQMLPLCDLLIVNRTEADQLTRALGLTLADLPVPEVLVTDGAQGAEWRSRQGRQKHWQKSWPVQAVDTTGAGDCFAGYFCAIRDMGHAPALALRVAAAAAALSVTRPGAAEAIPRLEEVEDMLGGPLSSL